MLLACFEFRLFFSEDLYDLALLEDDLFQVCDEPRNVVEVCSSSFPSVRKFEAGVSLAPVNVTMSFFRLLYPLVILLSSDDGDELCCGGNDAVHSENRWAAHRALRWPERPSIWSCSAGFEIVFFNSYSSVAAPVRPLLFTDACKIGLLSNPSRSLQVPPNEPY